MQVNDRGHLTTAGGCVKDGEVLGNQMGVCMQEKGPEKELLGDKYSFLLLTSVGTSKGLEDVDTGQSPGD